MFEKILLLFIIFLLGGVTAQNLIIIFFIPDASAKDGTELFLIIMFSFVAFILGWFIVKDEQRGIRNNANSTYT
jgi:hypothetical protein